MAKVYTVREMREEAQFHACKHGEDYIVATMLRQAADAMELITKLKTEIDGMETAPLDGVFAHMNINAKVALAKLDFYKKVSALADTSHKHRKADAMEREERREKKEKLKKFKGEVKDGE